MSDYENKFWSLQGEINTLKVRLQKLQDVLKTSLAPAFYGARMDRARLEALLSNIPNGEELTVFVPRMDQYIKMHFGDGGSPIDGCDNYIDYTLYDSDFEEVDGGQYDFNTYKSHYVGDIRKAACDVVEFAYSSLLSADEFDFIPINCK